MGSGYIGLRNWFLGIDPGLLKCLQIQAQSTLASGIGSLESTPGLHNMKNKDEDDFWIETNIFVPQLSKDEEERIYLFLNYQRNEEEAKYLFLNYRRNEDETKYLFPNYRRNEDEAKYLFLNYLRNEDEAKYSFLNYLRNEDEAKYSFLNYQ
jgi:hypothetical protein